MFIVKRDQFYTDLTPLTNNLITTTANVGSQTTSVISMMTPGITNSDLQYNTQYSSTNDIENILTDTASSVLQLSSKNHITVSTTGIDTTSNFETSNDQTSIVTTSKRPVATSSYTNNADSYANSKKKALVWGLFGSLLILSLL
jgi:hypothetical protein